MNSTAIASITAIFEGADERNWPRVQAAMADTVLLDYTSMSGGEPALLSPAEIIAAWAGFLPGFDKTHHRLSNFKTTTDNDKTAITFDGIADHFIGDTVWTVTGNYYAEAQSDGKVSLLRFNFKQASGDTSLPGKAILRLKPEV